MTGATFILNNGYCRREACRAIGVAHEGMVVEIREPRRSNDQNAFLHAAITEIAEQMVWPPPPAQGGRHWSLTIWKRLCMASWLREKGEMPEMIPALDGNGFDVIYERTSKLNVQQCTEFLEWCLAFGAQNGVKFKDK